MSVKFDKEAACREAADAYTCWPAAELQHAVDLANVLWEALTRLNRRTEGREALQLQATLCGVPVVRGWSPERGYYCTVAGKPSHALTCQGLGAEILDAGSQACR